jgi:hypothetical protein
VWTIDTNIAGDRRLFRRRLLEPIRRRFQRRCVQADASAGPAITLQIDAMIGHRSNVNGDFTVSCRCVFCGQLPSKRCLPLYLNVMPQTKAQGHVETLFAVDRIRSVYSIKTTTVLYWTTIEAVPVGCRGLAPESEFTFSVGIFAKSNGRVGIGLGLSRLSSVHDLDGSRMPAYWNCR